MKASLSQIELKQRFPERLAENTTPRARGNMLEVRNLWETQCHTNENADRQKLPKTTRRNHGLTQSRQYEVQSLSVCDSNSSIIAGVHRQRG